MESEGEKVVLQFGELPGLDLVDGDGVVEIEVAAFDSTEFEHVGAASEATPEIGADGSDVCPFRAMDCEVDIGKFDTCDVERMDSDFTWLAFDGLSFSGEFVERLAVEFDGGDHGGRLQLRPDEGGSGFTDLRFRDN